jgi:hypothetical protein
MSEFLVTGNYDARIVLEAFIKQEFQFEVWGSNKRLLIVFYKGVWAICEPTEESFVQMDDGPSVPLNGICSYGLSQEREFYVNNTWLRFLKQRIKSLVDSRNGKEVILEDLHDNPARDYPALAIADLVFKVMPKIDRFHVVKAGRNGLIENGKIIGC